MGSINVYIFPKETTCTLNTNVKNVNRSPPKFPSSVTQNEGPSINAFDMLGSLICLELSVDAKKKTYIPH